VICSIGVYLPCNNLCQITNFKFVEFSFPEFNLDLARGYITLLLKLLLLTLSFLLFLMVFWHLLFNLLHSSKIVNYVVKVGLANSKGLNIES
jgi:hypothetical protein